MLKKQLRSNARRTKFPEAIEINAVEPLRFDPKPDVALSSTGRSVAVSGLVAMGSMAGSAGRGAAQALEREIVCQELVKFFDQETAKLLADVHSQCTELSELIKVARAELKTLRTLRGEGDGELPSFLPNRVN
jgi:hypothetical protein